MMIMTIIIPLIYRMMLYNLKPTLIINSERLTPVRQYLVFAHVAISRRAVRFFKENGYLLWLILQMVVQNEF